ncbi:MAG: ATP-binding cassette domain-containing protein [Gammaproteobacteria bacterium]
MAELRLEHLHPPRLKPASFRVPAGRCLALHGPSGAGKSLLLRAIADLDPNAGEVWLGGTPRSAMTAPAWRRRVVLIPAESHWWADTVGAHAGHWDAELLAELGFSESVLDWEVSRLSSGERQRLALARALTLTPEVLLLDEPTANLDAENTARTEAVLRAYREAHRVSVIWVSHDPAQRRRVAGAELRIADGTVEGDAAWN